MVCLNYNSLSLFHMELLLNTGAYDLSQTREIIRNCWVFFFKYIQAPSSFCFMVLQFSKDLFLCSVILTSDFYSFIQNFKKSFSSLPSPLILLLLSVYYILYLALLGRMESLFFSDYYLKVFC